ncbi:uncharacterized protein V1510DRAFT_182630 [Dipodascopsis tothii]|uniref:uncharacterized protein n=1 Tax=Dipodascopsis tothii TaxID=44089 RepID=UPI0034CDD4EF
MWTHDYCAVCDKICESDSMYCSEDCRITELLSLQPTAGSHRGSTVSDMPSLSSSMNSLPISPFLRPQDEDEDPLDLEFSYTPPTLSYLDDAPSAWAGGNRPSGLSALYGRTMSIAPAKPAPSTLAASVASPALSPCYKHNAKIAGFVPITTDEGFDALDTVQEEAYVGSPVAENREFHRPRLQPRAYANVPRGVAVSQPSQHELDEQRLRDYVYQAFQGQQLHPTYH